MFLLDKLPLGAKLRLKRMLFGSPGKGSRTEYQRRHETQVLVIDDVIPSPDRDAGSARMMHILRILAERHDVVFMAISSLARPEYEAQLREAGIEIASPLDLHRILRERQFIAAILSRPDIADPLTGSIRRLAPNIKIIYDMVDVHHLRLEREAQVTGDTRLNSEAKRYRDMEIRAARRSDLVWCTSRADQEIMRTLAPETPSEIVPTIHEIHSTGPEFDDRRDLIFVGSFAHRPNVDAVHFLGREVIPVVRRSLPDVELLVVGGGAPESFSEYASSGVRVLGYVPDLDPVLRETRVFVAPVRYGAGINGKIGEALGYGVPVVTTAVGAKGWDIVNGDQALIADTADEFAKATIRLYSDRELWKRVRNAGTRHLEKAFTPEAVREVINNSLVK